MEGKGLKKIKPLTITVIGSYPLCEKEGDEALENAVISQINAGVELISDGQTRYDMIKYFTTHIPGFKVVGDESIVDSKIMPPEDSPIVKDLIKAKELAKNKAKVKGIITGPVTLISSCKISKSAPYKFMDPNLFLDAAEALAEEAKMFVKAGVDAIQIDEPFYSVGAPLELGKKCVELICRDLKVPVALHVCGDVKRVFDILCTFEGVDVLSHEFAATPTNLEVIRVEKLIDNNKMLGVGCVKSNNPAIETPEEVKDLLLKVHRIVGYENMIVHPDCGLRLLDCDVALNKLNNMVKGVSLFKKELKIS